MGRSSADILTGPMPVSDSAPRSSPPRREDHQKPEVDGGRDQAEEDDQRTGGQHLADHLQPHHRGRAYEPRAGVALALHSYLTGTRPVTGWDGALLVT
jgi:hypothetical protein